MPAGFQSPNSAFNGHAQGRSAAVRGRAATGTRCCQFIENDGWTIIDNETDGPWLLKSVTYCVHRQKALQCNKVIFSMPIFEYCWSPDQFWPVDHFCNMTLTWWPVVQRIQDTSGCLSDLYIGLGHIESFYEASRRLWRGLFVWCTDGSVQYSDTVNWEFVSESAQ